MKTAVFIQNRDFFGTRLIHLPFLDALNKAYRANELSVFSPYANGSFFKDIGVAERVHVYRPGIARMVKMLRQIKPDMIVSLRPASIWLNVAIALSGARVRLGYATFAGRWLFTATVPSNTRIYRAFNYANLFSLAGVDVKLDAYFREQARHATLRLPPGRELFCMMPGGGAGDFKRWGTSNFIRLCEALSQRFENAAFIFVLGPDERDEAARIRAASIGAASVVLLNESIAACARAVASSRATVANDCGPAHIAQMMQVPFVGVFSNVDGLAEARIGEWFYPRENALAVISEPGRNIKMIPVDRVAAALDQVLALDRTASP